MNLLNYMNKIFCLFFLCFCFINSAFAEDYKKKTNLKPTTNSRANNKAQDIKKEVPQKTDEEFNHLKKNASIQILDKITAHAENIVIPVGGEYLYSNLRIRVFACWASSPYDLKEDKILISVFETKNGLTTNIFKGWLFSSSPAISTLEHSVFDIVALSCYN